jgi:hypothetical protein
VYFILCGFSECFQQRPIDKNALESQPYQAIYSSPSRHCFTQVVWTDLRFAIYLLHDTSSKFLETLRNSLFSVAENIIML